MRHLIAPRTGVVRPDRLHPLRELLERIADVRPHRRRGEPSILARVGDAMDGAIELPLVPDGVPLSDMERDLAFTFRLLPENARKIILDLVLSTPGLWAGENVARKHTACLMVDEKTGEILESLTGTGALHTPVAEPLAKPQKRRSHLRT